MTVEAAVKPLKAYSVQGSDEGTIVFAHHSIVARREGANELNLDFDQIESCRRAPELDQYAGQGFVSLRVLVEQHGWRTLCCYCEGRIYSDEEGAAWIGAERAYCCEGHKAKHMALHPELAAEDIG